ncbi:U3 small nucleolar RNA-associated protein 3 [Kwoniella mangroviensis CBS 8886]|nr:U3 small nucleolar RNA-associated protein 3 [Kwoniella mangroviensis CBS 8886]
MAKKRSGKGVSAGSKASAAPGARINKIDRYEDTLEPGSVDDFMFKRDQISFNPQDESDDDDINANEGEEVLSLDLPKKSRKQLQREQEDQEDDDNEEEVEITKKQRKEKKNTPDLNGKGRFGKPIESSDEDDDSEGSDSGSDEDSEDENWGRQYYSKPSNRREKEDGRVDDEKREEEREMEEREVRRLQKKAREALDAEDFGFVQDDLSEPAEVEKIAEAEPQSKTIPAPPKTNDPVALLRHLEAHEPVKLALARDFPLIVKKLEKTSRGIKKMEEQKGDGELHKGLGWLHYQTLLTYATTLAFYIHLSSLPPSARGEGEINIIPRLLQLKEGLAMLEDLDFAAGSVSDGAFNLHPRMGLGDDETDEELKEGKMELLKRMQGLNGDEDDEDEDQWEDEMGDADDLWGKEGLEEGELEALLQDAEDDEEANELREMIKLSEKAKKKGKKTKILEDAAAAEEEDGLVMDLDSIVVPKKDKTKKKSKSKKDKTEGDEKSSKLTFAPLAEPEFFIGGTSSSSSKKSPVYDELDVLVDPTSLGNADYEDKQTRKRSLAFHTSKINSTLARREQGRQNRMGGDEDLPYRDKRKARDDALKRSQTNQAVGEDLDLDAEDDDTRRSKSSKRSREDEDGQEDDGEEDYYDLVKRRRKEEKNAKEAEHEAYEAEKLAAIASLDDPSHEGGPRALTRAIEKNRGLTPHRSKGGRNPRVKKRQQYEKAKKKVASQRSVYKGGQGAYGGEYKGEKTGISKVIKSRKF